MRKSAGLLSLMTCYYRFEIPYNPVLPLIKQKVVKIAKIGIFSDYLWFSSSQDLK